MVGVRVWWLAKGASGEAQAMMELDPLYLRMKG